MSDIDVSRGIVCKELASRSLQMLQCSVRGRVREQNLVDGNMQGNKVGNSTERIYRLERDEEVMFLIGIKSGDLFFETRIGSVEMR